ncbi:uncharacterized protein LOC142223163 isoform X2 [Haematobia irritans]|uniref:uncharacterized protein LOC142223163 isoform X2 n=1 Tax=Haematobia irritans TaxID=7368 RepID=UPI003F50A1D5
MASFASCSNDPNFAVICSFLQKFGADVGVNLPNFKQLQEWLTKTDEVAPPLKDMHIKLMRKTRKTVHEKSWESALSKFCFCYSAQDAWEIERFGYKNASIKVKLRILRELLESQFERNAKFRAKILAQSADSLRSEPIGRDRLGHAYWFTQDNDCNLRIYQEHLDEEIWQVVATNRDEFVNLIERLRGNEVVLPSNDIGVVDEDTSSSNSLEAKAIKDVQSHEDENEDDKQKVPKLSIKIVNSRSPKDETKDVGKGEEELAEEEDAKLNKKTKDVEQCDEEFEEIEEEYEEESETQSGKTKLVEPLLISQNKIKNTLPEYNKPESASKKRQIGSSNEESKEYKKQKPSIPENRGLQNTNKNGKENEKEDIEYDEGSTEEDVEEEDIDSAAAEEDENEEKHIEDFDDDEDACEAPVGDEISDPVLHVRGVGSGNDCDTANIWNCADFGIEDQDVPTVGSAIEESVFLISGEGSGFSNMVGNVKNDDLQPNTEDGEKLMAPEDVSMSKLDKGSDTTPSITSDTDLIKKSPKKCESTLETKTIKEAEEISKNTDNKDEIPKIKLNMNEASSDDEADDKKILDVKENDQQTKIKDKVTSDSKQSNTKINSTSEHLKREVSDTKTTTSDNNTTGPSITTAWSRKRRLEEFVYQQQTNVRLQSESEIDIHSENTNAEDGKNDVSEVDIGGKRPKIRQKQNNAELRKKVEAQKAAANDETTSSSGEEDTQRRRKLVSPKKLNEKVILKPETEQVTKTNNTNGQHKNESNITSKTDTKQKPSTSNMTTSSTKHKPTLDEIIERKLKKTPAKEKNDKNSMLEDVTTKKELSIPKKSPVTKPLKKTLLTQIMQDKCEKEDINTPKKSQKNESSCVFSTTNKQNVIPERQRKRHSSEETDHNVISEGPEAKKEVLRNDNKGFEGNSKNESSNKNSKDQYEKLIIKDGPKEATTELAGRRSGRRANMSVVYCEMSQTKRCRGLKKGDKLKECKQDGKKECDELNVVAAKNEDKIPSSSSIKSEELDGKTKPVKPTETELDPLGDVNLITPTKNSVKGNRKQKDVDATNIIESTDTETPVRQSRRIAQQKIREEAERRKLEEIALRTMKQELKKKKKAEKQLDPTVEPPPTEPSSESAESDVELKKKTQKKKCPGKNGSWSSGSEEQEDPDDEEFEEHPHYDTDPGSPLFKSDHEFSPESDIEDESQVVPMKRARTVRKENAEDGEQIEEEEACQKCNKSDHPEWILLCDKCDKGYHCSCLSPVLFYIPEGDWYCPPCQQEELIKALESQLNEFDHMVERKKKEQEEEVRLAEEAKAREEEEKRNQKKSRRNSSESSDGTNSEFSDENNGSLHSKSGKNDSETANPFAKIGSSAKNKNNDKRSRNEKRQKSMRRTRNRRKKSESDSDSQNGSNSDSASSRSSSSSSFSESDNEPIYKLRKRRQINVSYRLNEYDDLINSALKKEMDEVAGAGNLGRGKDISTILEADKEEKARQKQIEDSEATGDVTINNELTKENEDMSPTKKKDDQDNATDSDDEPIRKVSQSKQSLKKKPRKLTTLDITSEDDDASDEDFKGSSIDDDEDEETSVSATSNSDSSLEVYKRKGKSKKKQRKAARRAFRERRKDRKFVVDETDDEEVQRPKSKKKRKDDTDYTESEVDDDDLSELSENIDSADLCDDTTTDESDGAWRPNKRKKTKKSNVSPPKIQKSKQQVNKSKKLEYSDDDISESEEDDENDDDNEGVGGGKQPRSQPLIATKAKSKTGTRKKKKSSDEDQSLSDSEDSTRRTRGRRYAYIEDFDDDSSDGGIKPGVKRPDTPPEEREKFIKRQEEIKRMLAEKNAEGAKLVATPRLTPIKSESDKDKKSPTKGLGGDSLSTVPLSVIRQAKVLDIDYLQRRGENMDDLSTDVGDVDDFDDADLPDDLPEDMDEDAIARMVEDEEEFVAVSTRELPPPDEVLRTPCTPAKPKPKEIEKSVFPTQPTALPSQQLHASTTVSPSGLQEPVRKRFPMPTMHPPLLRHQFAAQESLTSGQQIVQRQPAPRNTAPQGCHLLNALSAPLSQSLPRQYSPSLITRMTNTIQLQTSSAPVPVVCRSQSPIVVKSAQQLNLQTQNKSSVQQPTEPENKPRGRRKKFTPLRDTLQKQQTAAAIAAVSGAVTSDASKSAPSSVIKGGPLVRCPQTSTIQSAQPIPARTMPSLPTSIYTGAEGYYGTTGTRAPPPQRHRGPSMVQSHLTSHPAIRHSYGPPPPLKGTGPITAPTGGNQPNVRPPLHHMPPFLGGPPTGRHSTPHLNLYGQSLFGNPNFGPRGHHRPSPIHSSEYPTGSRAYPPYGFYPPPPPLTTPHRAPTSLQQPPASVIVSNVPPPSSNVSTTAASEVNSPERIPKTVVVKQELDTMTSPSKMTLNSICKTSPEPKKKLTTLEAYSSGSTAAKPSLVITTPVSKAQSSPGNGSRHAVESPPRLNRETPPPISGQRAGSEGHASEFSGLVSYFSSQQQDEYNT